ncbi:MAG: BTAD domain-containing putative transcriptional regulator, partial [Ornithinimicrobium sp.]
RDEAGQPAALSLDVLGPVRLRRDDTDVPLTTLERTLLAALAVSRPRVVSVESLVEWMWGGSEHASSRNRVQAVVSGVRRKVAPARVIETHEMGYRLHSGVTTDLARRDRLMEAAHESGPDRRRHREHLHAAHALLIGVSLHGCRPTPGLDGMRRRLDDVGLEIQAERIEADLEEGAIEGLAAELAALTDRHPYHEHVHALLMRVLVRVGRQADALATHRLMLQRLDTELGVRPGPLLNAALEEVLRFSDEASGPPPADPRASLGESSGSVAPKDAPRYADVLSTPRTAPRSVSVLIGRDAEMDAVLREARGPTADNSRGPAPLIAITGLGGMGKSALAIEAAHRLHDDFADGTLYLHLGTETGRGGVPAILGHFLSLLGISAEACPPGLDARVALFRSVLDDRRVLVVLDDVPADVDLTYVLPTRAPCAAILTSRSALDDYEPSLRVPLRSLAVGAAQGLFEAQLDPARVNSHGGALATLAAQCYGLPLLLRVTAQRVAARPDLSLAEASRGLALASTDSDADPMRAAVAACLGLAQAPLDPLSRTVLSRFAALPFRGASHWLLTALVSDQPNAAVAASSAVAQLQAASLLDPVARDGVGTQYEVH